jgi:CRISPR-associated protein Cas6/Cse3/CasE subtype I-E
MYVTKLKKTSADIYKNHQQVCGKFDQQKRMFYVDDKFITIYSEKPVDESIEVEINYGIGKILNFKTKLIPIKKDIRTKRLRKLEREETSTFVVKRFENSGCELVDAQIEFSGEALINKPESKFKYDYVSVAGQIKITDLKLFKQTLLSGLRGKSKTFGFGMLNIF